MKPGPLWVPLCFGAGLATGLARFQAPLLLLLGAAVIAVMRRCEAAERPKQSPSIHTRHCEEGRRGSAGPTKQSRSIRTELPWYLALVVAGIPLGTVTRELATRSCAARLPAATLQLTVRLVEPLSVDGGLVRVRPVGAGCSGEIRARIRGRESRVERLQSKVESRKSKVIPAGATLRVTGSWLPDTQALGHPGGLLAVSTFDFRLSTSDFGPSTFDSFRTGLSLTIERLYGSRAPLVDALVTGRRADLDRDLKEAFARSGLVHLLSISGFHVGVIAAWLTLLLRACNVSRERSLLLAALVSTAYVGFLGWPAPALRAAGLAWIIAWLRYRQRAAVPDAALALTALLVLVFTPWAVADLGGWLSALALWGATRCSRWGDAEILREDRSGREGFIVRARRSLVQTALASVGATAATAPLTAAALGAVAPIGIALNLVAIPLAALAVPAVFASLVLAPLLPPLARSMAAGGGLGLHLIERLAILGSAIPGGHLAVPAEPRAALPWLGALAAMLWITRRHTTRSVALTRLLAAGAVALWIALLVQTRIPNEDGRLALHFLDVGQGDAAVIRTPRGHVVVVDAGPRSVGGDRGRGADAGRRVLVPFLQRTGVRRVDVFIASHGHLDHVGGAPALLERLSVATVIEPAAPVGDPAYLDFIAAVARSDARWDPAEAGESFEADGVRFQLLHPRPGWKDWGLDVNDDSVVLLVEYGGFRAVLAGDIGFAAEAEMRRRIGRVDLLKVGHHGSGTSSGDAWLNELRPRIGVVSVGRNRYGHPAPAAMARLRAHNVDIWRTDEQGSITVLTDGQTVEVRGRRKAVRFAADP